MADHWPSQVSVSTYLTLFITINFKRAVMPHFKNSVRCRSSSRNTHYF
ncbi:hypothetical protein Nizo2776_3115 [Lactiplantibacillus plantarum]|nr:hypothetical protein Nizo2776_3115 [Lactiplantibacillus plantarum]